MSETISGRKPVLEAIRSERQIEKIQIQFGAHGEVIQTIKRLAKQRSIPVVEVDKQKFREIAPGDSAQGVVAILGATQYVEIEDILRAASSHGEPAMILVLDDIEDPHNLGALIRTAECAGFHGVIIPRHHSATVNESVMKSSAGAAMHLPVARVANISSALEEIKKNGAWVIGSAEEGDRLYTEVDYTGPIALVVGNEGKGIRRLVRDHCDFLVRIPLYGKIDSLNASVAGALIMFEAAKARHLRH